MGCYGNECAEAQPQLKHQLIYLDIQTVQNFQDLKQLLDRSPLPKQSIPKYACQRCAKNQATDFQPSARKLVCAACRQGTHTYVLELAHQTYKNIIGKASKASLETDIQKQHVRLHKSEQLLNLILKSEVEGMKIEQTNFVKQNSKWIRCLLSLERAKQRRERQPISRETLGEVFEAIQFLEQFSCPLQNIQQFQKQQQWRQAHVRRIIKRLRQPQCCRDGTVSFTPKFKVIIQSSNRLGFSDIMQMTVKPNELVLPQSLEPSDFISKAGEYTASVMKHYSRKLAVVQLSDQAWAKQLVTQRAQHYISYFGQFINAIQQSKSQTEVRIRLALSLSVARFCSLRKLLRKKEIQLDSFFITFQAQNHDFSSDKYLQYCTKITKALTLVSAGGNIIGGYSKIQLDLDSKSLFDKEAFVFDLQKCLLYGACDSVKENLYIGRGSGPTFGSGDYKDIYIADQCNLNKYSYSNLGVSFKVAQGQQRQEFAHFKVDNYLVLRCNS